MLRWPPDPDTTPTDTASAAGAAVDLFATCRTLLSPGGFTVVALLPPPPGPPYVEHAQVVIPAAHRAGLGYLQHIIAVTAPISGEPAPRRTAPTHRATLRAATHLRAHLDLLVFVLRRTHARAQAPSGSPRIRNPRSGGPRRRAPGSSQ